MKHALKTFCLLVLLALTAYGCKAVGPDFKAQTVPVKDNWLEYKDSNLDSTAPVAPEWWQAAFQDPTLDQLVKTALEQNLTLRAAGLRVLQARQQLMIAIGNQYPQQQQITGQAAIAGTVSSSAYGIYDLGFNLSWEADIWGRFSRLIESASALLDASVAGYDGVMVILVADVAQTYLLIRTTQQRLFVARQNLEVQQESVRITKVKFNAGAVSSLDIAQAQTLFYNTQASVFLYEQSLQQFKNSLAILLGQPPHDMSELLGTTQPVPTVSTGIAVGMPQDLIRRRPDIRAAEGQLAAQSAQIGFAIADLYPHLGIGGSIGPSITTANELQFSDLFNSDAIGYSLFGFFEWNIFNYGRLKNNVRLQDALFQQLLENYRNTVLTAQGEVENAIIAFFKSRQQLQAFRLADDAAQRAVNLSMEQYTEGEVDFNTVITTLRTLSAQQDQLAATEGTVATNLVAIYKSLGGGWETRQGENPIDLIPVEVKKEMLERTDYWDKAFKKE